MLDGLGPHHSDQPNESLRPTFSDTLKFGVGGYGSGSQPVAESKSGVQSRINESTRVFLIGESSNPSSQPPLSNPVSTQKEPPPSIDEFLACYLLGKFGESQFL